MFIKKLVIENFKCFEGRFSLNLNEGLNILVGDNESGKSTILEAIHLALTGWIYGKYLKAELTQSLFNSNAVKIYLESLQSSTPLPPPHVLIELFLSIKDVSLGALFEGNKNSLKHKACGFQFEILFNEKYQKEYQLLIEESRTNTIKLKSLPIEYYDFHWSSFGRDDRLTPKTIPLKSAFIDSSTTHYRTGSDVYISRIIQDFLTDKHKIKIAQAHRNLKDIFSQEEIIKLVNKEIKQKQISDKKIELSVDLSTKTAWETSLVTYLDEIPFHSVGQGEQCMVKTKLALSHKKSKEANILLLEEPENHLTHSKLNKLINYIKNSNVDKQIIVSTHSSFVANKLGLANLILLTVDITNKKRKETRIIDLSGNTKEYFEKLAGYDTLRFMLCKKAILVEGDSDELIVQKAYRVKNGDKLPIHDEIDVISVGTSFLRFLEISEKLHQPVVVVTDNDGDVAALKEKYNNYLNKNAKDYITICFDEQVDEGSLKIGNRDFNYNTLEPKLLKANSLTKLNDVFGTTYTDIDDMYKHMKNNKTECALLIFNTHKDIAFPQYILDAIG